MPTRLKRAGSRLTRSQRIADERAQARNDLAALAADRLRAMRFFSDDDYFHLNPDLNRKTTNAAQHAVSQGKRGGRTILRPLTVARALGAVGSDLPFADSLPSRDNRSADLVNVLVSSRGNVFMREIAKDLVRDFQLAGAKAVLLDEHVERPTVGTNLVVAPHEFFVLGKGTKWRDPGFVADAFMYNTEQMQTPWFTFGLPWLLSCRGVIDLSPQIPPLLREGGMPAVHYEPRVVGNESALTSEELAHPLLDGVPDIRMQPTQCEWQDRPIDLSFFGNQSPKRDAMFARWAGRFAPYRNFIYYTRNTRPVADAALTKIAGFIATQSKIYLNVHRDEFNYFEWHRIVRQGMGSGAVVVSDDSLTHPVYKAGVHFLETDLRDIPNLVDWVLRDPQGRQKAQEIVTAASQLLADQRASSQTSAVLEFMAGATA